MQPKFELNQKVRIISPLAKIKWGIIHQIQIGKLHLSIIQKMQHPETVMIYWVKCGLGEFIHGYYEHELENH